jgi:hypothetical protein
MFVGKAGAFPFWAAPLLGKFLGLLTNIGLGRKERSEKNTLDYSEHS